MRDDEHDFSNLAHPEAKPIDAVNGSDHVAAPATPEVQAVDLFSDLAHPNAKTVDISQPNNESKPMISDANLLYGPSTGAAVAGAGHLIHNVYGGAQDIGTELLARSLKKAFPQLAPQEDALANQTEPKSSGQKWFNEIVNRNNPNGYTPPAEDATTIDAAHAYNKQKVDKRTKVAKVLESKFGRMLPGKLSIKGDTAFEPKATEPVVGIKPSYWETEGGKLLSKFGHGAANLFPAMAHGAMHGLNAVVQTDMARNAQDKLNAFLHGTSAAGSGMNILSHALPNSTASGMRQLGNPLAVLASGAADVQHGYVEGTEPKRENETEQQYQKRKAYGQAGIPSAIFKTGLGMISLPAGFASQLPPLSLEYASQNPKQVQQWEKTGMYENPEELISPTQLRNPR